MAKLAPKAEIYETDFITLVDPFWEERRLSVRLFGDVRQGNQVIQMVKELLFWVCAMRLLYAIDDDHLCVRSTQ